MTSETVSVIALAVMFASSLAAAWLWSAGSQICDGHSTLDPVEQVEVNAFAVGALSALTCISLVVLVVSILIGQVLGV